MATENIAENLQVERKLRGWTLDDLSRLSQVSRAMISKIERGVSSPSAVLLARLADAMGLPMTSLMFKKSSQLRSVEVLDEQSVWQDPDIGYTRRLVSAAVQEGDVEIVAIDLPVGARVCFPKAKKLQIFAKLLLLEGSLQLSFVESSIGLSPGDCVRIAIHEAHELQNLGNVSARYLIVTYQMHQPVLKV